MSPANKVEYPSSSCHFHIILEKQLTVCKRLAGRMDAHFFALLQARLLGNNAMHPIA
jgi:hypothetical protein